MSSLALNFGRAVRGLEKVWLAIFAVFAVLAVLQPAQAGASLQFVLEAFLRLMPFLMLSVGLAAAVKATEADNLVARAFQGRTVLTIGLATLMGVLSPFCSCGVIPLIASMLAMGVPLSAVMAFWLASPLMDPSMFLITTGTLGFDFALAKTAIAAGMGLFGGFGTYLLTGAGWFDRPLRSAVGADRVEAVRTRAERPVVWRFWESPERRAVFAEAAQRDLVKLGTLLLLAFLLESLMIAYVPSDLVGRVAGGEGLLPILAAVAVGVPAYLNGYAALPLVGGLIEQGMSPAAGMAFLIGGGVTSVPAMMAVFSLVRMPVFLAYLGFSFIGAVAAGVLFGFVA